MTVNDGGPVAPCGSGNRTTERRMKTRFPVECVYLDAGSTQLARPVTFVVKTAHGHRNLSVQSVHEFHNQPLSPSRAQAEHHLQYSELTARMRDHLTVF